MAEPRQEARANASPSTDSAQAPEPAFVPGTNFDGRFELLAVLGRGATGTAYKARDVLLDRIVAIKILHGFLLANPKAVERFRQEALAGTSLSHPGISRVYSQSLSADGRLYLVMDCLEGKSLADILETEGKLQLDRFFRLFSQIIDALMHAHDKEIVHRDIKPNNIVVITTDQGKEQAVIVDFGIAKLITQASEQSSTQTGAMLGSSSYMSPEQCIGKDEADARSDIYSLGCVMLECLVGSAPFEGESALDIMYKHINESLGKLSFLKDMPDAISQILQKCLQKDPNKRYQHLAELKLDFQKCVDSEDTLNRKWKRQTSAKKINSRLQSAGVVVLLLAIGSLVFVVKDWRVREAAIEADKQVKPTKFTLAAPEQAKLSGKLNNIKVQFYEYRKNFMRNESIRLLELWETRFLDDRSVTLDTKAFVCASHVNSLMEQGRFKEASAYLSSLEKYKNIPEFAVLMASAQANMYKHLGKPELGITEIEKLMKTMPSGSQSSRQKLSMLDVEASCYMTMGSFKKASELYMKALKLANESQFGIDTLVDLETKALQAATMSNDKAAVKGLRTLIDKHVSANRDFAFATYIQLAHSFLLMGQLDQYEEYQRLADRANAPRLTEKQRIDSEFHVADIYMNHADYAKAALLNNKIMERNGNRISTRLSGLSRLSMIYGRTHQNDALKKNLLYTVSLLENELAKDPSFLWKDSGNDYALTLTVPLTDPEFDRKRIEKISRQISTILESKAPNSEVLPGIYAIETDCLKLQGRHDEALAVQAKYQALGERLKAIDMVGDALRMRGEVLFDQKKYPEALTAFYKLLALPEASVVPIRRHNATYRIFQILDLMGQKQEASKYRLELETDLLSTPPAQIPAAEDLGLLVALADYERAAGNVAQWELLIKKALQDSSIVNGSGSTALTGLLSSLGHVFQTQHKLDESNAVLLRGAAICKKYRMNDDPIYNQLYRQLALNYLEQKNYSKAEECFNKIMANKPSKAEADEVASLRKQISH